MSVTFNFTDSDSKEIVFEEDGAGWDDIYFKQNVNGVSFQGYPIKTIDELFACLCFYYYGEEIDFSKPSIVPVFTIVFQFLSRKISFDTMMEKIQNYNQETGNTLDWDLIDELEDISPDEFDDEDQLVETVKELFDYLQDDDFLNSLIKLSNKYKGLSDIESLVFYENCEDWGEFLNHFYEDLPDEDEFSQIEPNDPLFRKEVNKLTDVIMEAFPSGVNFDDDVDIKGSLESGNIEDCLQNIEHANTETWNRIYINKQKNSAEQGFEEKKAEKETSNLKTIESELFFEIKNIFRYRGTHECEKTKALVESGRIPNQFCEYPITDLLEKMPVKAMDIFLNSDLKLQYEDVAHYIFTGSLETLFPMFERGLRIAESAYDDLIAYANKRGQKEYAEWLLKRKYDTLLENSVLYGDEEKIRSLLEQNRILSTESLCFYKMLKSESYSDDNKLSICELFLIHENAGYSADSIALSAVILDNKKAIEIWKTYGNPKNFLHTTQRQLYRHIFENYPADECKQILEKLLELSDPKNKPSIYIFDYFCQDEQNDYLGGMYKDTFAFPELMQFIVENFSLAKEQYTEAVFQAIQYNHPNVLAPLLDAMPIDKLEITNFANKYPYDFWGLLREACELPNGNMLNILFNNELISQTIKEVGDKEPDRTRDVFLAAIGTGKPDTLEILVNNGWLTILAPTPNKYYALEKAVQSDNPGALEILEKQGWFSEEHYLDQLIQCAEAQNMKNALTWLKKMEKSERDEKIIE